MKTEEKSSHRMVWMRISLLLGLAGLVFLCGWLASGEAPTRVRIAVYLFGMASGLGLVIGMVIYDKRHPPAVRLPPGFGKPPHEAHFDALREGLRQASLPAVTAYRSRAHEQVHKYLRSRRGRPRVGPAEGPFLVVVLPEGCDPYWIRCNRMIEAQKYCRRQHRDDFDIDYWILPEPSWSQVRLVDLIG